MSLFKEVGHNILRHCLYLRMIKIMLYFIHVPQNKHSIVSSSTFVYAIV